ncbi:Helix-turn-helix domain-containing protein [Ruminococcus sp. YE71]|uniref:helix-turn-helix domain-containing protein n=1 Tax=unclassified Ruminococcus TaxID=2608920 RepID=UPI000890813A|nr:MULTISPECIES: helix-turn-helix domain-containing protein [unclassified Ruminococcus]SDA24860.1 Helix-turn-helix domain-containing protein [Ruminococcus sp. YE78]SFW43350.1 Helix-turn-helix domain-containing protein [Ruminococcus sp. YE71]
MTDNKPIIHAEADFRFVFFTVNDVAEILHCSYFGARDLFLQKSFPSRKICGRWLVSARDFLDWVNKQ